MLTRRQLLLRVVIGFLSIGIAPQVQGQLASWDVPELVPTETAQVVTTALADLDGDGDIDICSMRGTSAGRMPHWYENPNWTPHVMHNDPIGSFVGATVWHDFDGDGDIDVVLPEDGHGSGPGTLYIYENPGPTLVTGTWTRHTIYDLPSANHQNDMKIADMDGDSKMDVVVRTRGSARVIVCLQDSISSWTIRHWDTFEPLRPEGLALGDVDGDLHPDIILSGVFWSNPGGWRTGPYTEYSIDPVFVDEEVKSSVVDINNDGVPDIFMTSCEGPDRHMAWYESSTPQSGAWIKHEIEDPAGDYHMSEFLDMDGDGDLDLVTGRAFDSDGVFVFYNNNDGASWTKQTVHPSRGMYSGAVADMDQDGDLDIVGPDGYLGGLYIYRNLSVDLPPPGTTEFIRGDCNDNQVFELGDAILILGLLFSGLVADCADACDLNDNGSLQLADCILLLSGIFGGSPGLVDSCVTDSTPDTIDCAVYSGCLPDPSSALELALDFDDVMGGVAMDGSESDRDGTIIGATVSADTPDGSSGSVDFDGVDDVVSISPFNLSSNELTISAWIKPNNFANEGRIISRASGLSDSDHLYMLSVFGGDVARIRVGTTNGVVTVVGSLPLAQNVWSHVAGTYDGGQVRLYVNGSLDSATGHSGTLLSSTSVPIAVGNNPPGNGDRPFDGLIDGVRIYSVAQSPAEIAQEAATP